MSDKKGFFRRVFSFGHPEETAPERPVETGPVAEEVAETLLADGATETPRHPLAMEHNAAPSDAASAPDEHDASEGNVGTAPADEPEWLDPAAPEPEADFSWLEADESVSAEPERSAEGTDAETTAGIDADLASEPLPAEASSEREPGHTSPEPAVEREKTTPTTVEPDFSFLDPDAPLPDEEEEEADFSWLDADAPLPEAADEDEGLPLPEAGSVASVATAGIAAARASASAAPAEGGWRRREVSVAPVSLAPVVRTTWFERLREGLARSSSQLSGSINALFTKRRLDEETLQDFEDVLIQADLGVETALRITGRLSEGRFGKEITGEQVRQVLADEVEATLRPVALPLELDLEKKPHVILVVGVNGTGKTTTIGKLAAKLTRGGLKVTLCAGDTFRAAAVEQLKIWGERTGSEVVAKAIGADAAGLAFEAYDRAVENGSDVLIIDTAGRLQNKTELMAELEKIVRVLQRREPDAPHTVLQTLDATTGQNALSQVEIFRNVAGVNGLVMTKLDGTARGGILVAIAAKYRLPVYFIGVGEGIDDLEPFKARDFAMAIAGNAG